MINKTNKCVVILLFVVNFSIFAYSNNLSITVLYDRSCRWEVDFILYELLPQNLKYDITMINHAKIYDTDSYNYKLINPTALKVLVFSSLYTFNDNTTKVIEAINYLRPPVIFHLSDEVGLNPEFLKLSEKYLYIRQYSHPNHFSQPYLDYSSKSVIYMPLGYMTKMFDGKLSTANQEITATKERNYIWSFIGSVNRFDRELVLKVMKNFTDLYVVANNLSPPIMRELYRDSIFTPHGRGHNFACFRLYEASACGSIPIVVGNKSDLNFTFYYEENPPWIFAQTWEGALLQARELLSNNNTLLIRRRELLGWWAKRVEKIRDAIRNTLEKVK